MDLIYTLGHGSNWEDNELRYSLRAMHELVGDLGQVVIVGTRPRWLTNVLHIPARDLHTCKERNIMDKISLACRRDDLSQELLFANDDHFALAHQVATTIPNWRCGKLETLALKLSMANHYRQALLNTHEVLGAQGLDTWNFDIHTPIIYRRQEFLQVMANYDWEKHRGYVVKSLYANTLRLPHQHLGDCKLTQRYAYDELVTRLRGRPWWSVSDGALNPNLKRLLEALYPTPSPYEFCP